MKIVEMVGRLGNQMFIYAFAKALEHHSGERVSFDLTFYEKSDQTVELGNLFNIELPQATPFQLMKYNFYKSHKKISRWLCLPNRVLEEVSTNKFTPGLLTKRKEGYYSGYFQCEKYFKGIEQEIRRTFTFKVPADESLIAKRKEIESMECPIFINVRRGDYVTLDKENVVHWLCDMSYYREATKLMVE